MINIWHWLLWEESAGGTCHFLIVKAKLLEFSLNMRQPFYNIQLYKQKLQCGVLIVEPELVWLKDDLEIKNQPNNVISKNKWKWI